MTYVTLQDLIVEQLIRLESTVNGSQKIRQECNISDTQSPTKSNYSLGNSPEVNKIGITNIALRTEPMAFELNPAQAISTISKVSS